MLFYQGTDLIYPQDSYNVQRPIGGLRLKHWRRGIQDGDYLALAKAIDPVRVQEIVSAMVPKALWEYGVDNPNDPSYVHTDISWSVNPDVWEAARAELADIIVNQGTNRFHVSGTITTQNGAGIQSAVQNGLPGNPLTNTSGQYDVTVPEGFSGTVTPVKAGYTFNPAGRTYNNVTTDQPGQDYTANASSLGSGSPGAAGTGGGGGGWCYIGSASEYCWPGGFTGWLQKNFFKAKEKIGTLRGCSMQAKKANSFFMVFFTVFLLVGLWADMAQAGIRRIWAVDDGEKIKREDITNPLATSPDNAVWNGTKVFLFGCKNEVVAFQLMLEGDASGQTGVDMRITNLGNGIDTIPGSQAGSSDPYDYRGKSIELFTEHYLKITRRSSTGYHYLSPPPEYYCSGWLPDALIPFAAPSGLGGAPFEVLANQNQGVWVDVYIPRNVSAGVYTGAIEVLANSAVVQTIPVSLEVYDFVLSDETHLQNMFYYNSWGDLCLYAHGHNDDYSDWYYQNLDMKYRQMAHRHRMTLTREYLNLDRMSRYDGKYLDGSAFSAADKYAGPGENTGDSSFCIGIYGTRPQEWGGASGTRAQYWAGTDAWERWFRDNAPNVYRFHQVAPDEPYTPEQRLQARTECEWMRSNPGIGKNIPTFTTSQVIPELIGYIDFWSIWAYWLHPEWVNLQGIRDEQAAGRRIGVYNGGRPAFGANTLDVDATDFRVNVWILKKYGMNFYYYWETTYWTEVNCFSNPLTFGNSSNGAGTFFYPGQCVAYPAEDRGLPGPLSSIRMKNWRRGQQDYEYMWLAEQYSLQIEVSQIVNNCVPRAAWEAVPVQNIAWSARGYRFDVYRRQLAEIIANAQGRFSISGTVTYNGSGLAGVTISDLPGNPVTNASGQYTARVADNWSGAARPTLAGYTFAPVHREYTNITVDQTNQNYTATSNKPNPNPNSSEGGGGGGGGCFIDSAVKGLSNLLL